MLSNNHIKQTSNHRIKKSLICFMFWQLCCNRVSWGAAQTIDLANTDANITIDSTNYGSEDTLLLQGEMDAAADATGDASFKIIIDQNLTPAAGTTSTVPRIKTDTTTGKTCSNIYLQINQNKIVSNNDTTISGIDISIPNGSISTAESRLTIDNRGTIGSITSTPPVVRGAIKLEDAKLKLRLTNYGQIYGKITSVSTSTATPDDVIINNANATIQGDISLTGGADNLTNSGTITGAIDLGEGANLITNNTGGVITGNITAGANVDILTNSGTINGAINLGAGGNEITNNAGGVITGNITTGANVDILTNSGTISGAINLGAGANEITNNAGGVITGNITTGDDLDRFTNSGTINGAIHFGAGGNVITNKGRINGGITSGATVETIENDGEILGNLSLNAGGGSLSTSKSIQGNIDLGANGGNIFIRPDSAAPTTPVTVKLGGSLITGGSTAAASTIYVEKNATLDTNKQSIGATAGNVFNLVGDSPTANTDLGSVIYINETVSRPAGGVFLGTITNPVGASINIVNASNQSITMTKFDSVTSATDTASDDINLGTLQLVGGTLSSSTATALNNQGTIIMGSVDPTVNTTISLASSGVFTNEGDPTSNPAGAILDVIGRGTNTITADYVIGDNSTHRAYIYQTTGASPTATVTKLTVTGDITLPVTITDDKPIIEIRNPDGVFIPKNSELSIISTTASSTTLPTINSDSIKIVSDNPFITYTAEADDTDQDIKLTAARANYATVLSSLGVAEGSNSMSIGNILYAIADSADLTEEAQALIGAVENLVATSSSSALKQLIPDLNVSMASPIGFQNNGVVLNQVGSRINQIARLDHNDLGLRSGSGYAAGSKFANASFWIKALGSFNKQKAFGDSSGYNANTGGFTAGVDQEVDRCSILGVGFSYANTNAKTKDLLTKRNKFNSYQALLYGTYSIEPYYVDGVASIGLNKYKTSRVLQNGGISTTYNAKFSAIQPSLKVSMGAPKVMGDLRVVPNGSLRYSYVHQNQYDETATGNVVGAALNNVKAKNLHLLEGGLGFRLEHVGINQYKNFNPEAHVMALYDLVNTQQQISTQFKAGGGSFTLKGDKFGRFMMNAGFSLNYVNHKNVQFSVGYDLYNKKKYIGHSGELKIKYVF